MTDPPSPQDPLARFFDPRWPTAAGKASGPERILSWIARGAGTLLLVSIGVHMAWSGIHGTTVVPAFVLVHLAALLLIVLAGVASVAVRTARTIQPRLGEILCSVAAGGILLAAVLPSHSAARPIPLGAAFGWAGAIAVCIGLGSAWGWVLCSRHALQDTRQRLLVLMAGWGLVPGFLAAVYGVVSLAADFAIWGVAPVAGVLLAVPGWVVDSRLRRR